MRRVAAPLAALGITLASIAVCAPSAWAAGPQAAPGPSGSSGSSTSVTFTVPPGATVTQALGTMAISVTRSPDVLPHVAVPCTLTAHTPFRSGSLVGGTATGTCAATVQRINVDVTLTTNGTLTSANSNSGTNTTSVTATTGSPYLPGATMQTGATGNVILPAGSIPPNRGFVSTSSAPVVFP